jgi:hypothetical protein
MPFSFELANEMECHNLETGNIGAADEDKDLIFIQ